MSPAGGTPLSVALATHDGARWLPDLLADLAAQARPPDELVVHDDGSTDATVAVVEAFAAGAPFPVRLAASSRRRGPVRAFEAALAATRGTLVALADQDDRWHPDKLLVLEAALAAPDTTLAFCDADTIDEDGADRGRRLWAELGFRRREQDDLVSAPPGPVLRHAVASGCTALVRRRVVDLALPFPAALDLVATPMLHDRWLATLAACTGRVAPVPVPLVDYRCHPGQAVGARWVTRRGEVGRQARRRVADVAARAEARVRQLDALADRLVDRDVALTPAVVAQLDAARHHHRVRAGLGRRSARVGPVLAELASGGYRRFGEGPASALLDLVRR